MSSLVRFKSVRSEMHPLFQNNYFLCKKEKKSFFSNNVQFADDADF